MPFTQLTESKTQKYVLCTFINRSKSIIMDENKRVWIGEKQHERHMHANNELISDRRIMDV